MPDFVGKDPRGFTVILTEETIEHAAKHHEEIGFNFELVQQVLIDPAFILPNQSNVRQVRTGNERYVGFVQTLNTHLVVPVRTTVEIEMANEVVVQPGARAATTFYTRAQRPLERPIWIKPTR